MNPEVNQVKARQKEGVNETKLKLPAIKPFSVVETMRGLRDLSLNKRAGQKRVINR